MLPSNSHTVGAGSSGLLGSPAQTPPHTVPSSLNPFKPANHKQQALLGLPHHLPELLKGGLLLTDCATMSPLG